jgi:hypothetical protein
MNLTRLFGFTTLGVLLGGTAIIAAACGGDDGNDGAQGVQGAAGAPGAPGAAGAQGVPGPVGDGGAGVGVGLSGACTTPCHTFNGVVDQWRFSNHSHPQENEIGGGTCGNCHGIDGLAQRVANKFLVTGDSGAPTNVQQGHINYKASPSGSISEMSYAGASTIGRIHCSTCHDFNSTNDPHVTGKYLAGQAPLRIAGGVNDMAFLEKSPLASVSPVGQSVQYRAANTCVFCHKSRKDVTLYIGANNPITNGRWGPHEGPQSDVFSGKGGYHFTGLTYSTSAHASIATACVACHMQPVAGNANVPDHTMKPQLAFCKTCHTTYNGTTFDVQGGQSLVKDALTELQGLLDTAGLLTRSESAPYVALTADEKTDGQFHLDATRAGSGPGGANQNLTTTRAGALYNYLIVARSKDYGVHNPTYAKQLLWDSIREFKGADPSSLPARPQ